MTPQVLVVGQSNVQYAGLVVVGLGTPRLKSGGNHTGDHMYAFRWVARALDNVPLGGLGHGDQMVASFEWPIEPKLCFEPSFDGLVLVEHAQVMHRENERPMAHSNRCEVNVACDVDQRPFEAADFFPDFPSVHQAGGEPIDHMNFGLRRTLWPCVPHGFVRSFNAEIPQASRLAHDPNDVG